MEDDGNQCVVPAPRRVPENPENPAVDHESVVGNAEGNAERRESLGGRSEWTGPRIYAKDHSGHHTDEDELKGEQVGVRDQPGIPLVGRGEPPRPPNHYDHLTSHSQSE